MLAGKFVLNHLTQKFPVCCLCKAASQILMMMVQVAVVELGCMFWNIRTFDCLQKC